MQLQLTDRNADRVKQTEHPRCNAHACLYSSSV